jgi:hypothetical protein
MTDQTLPQSESPENKEIARIGFEQALIMFDPQWRTNLQEGHVNSARHFYNQGMQNMLTLINLQNQQMQQNVGALMQNMAVTGNEAKIEAARAQALAEAKAAEAQAAEGGEASEPAVEEKPKAKAAKQPNKPAAKVGKKAKK